MSDEIHKNTLDVIEEYTVNNPNEKAKEYT